MIHSHEEGHSRGTSGAEAAGANGADGHLRYLLTAYLFDSLSDAGRSEVEGHLAACAACREELEELRGTLAAVESALEPPAKGAEGYAFEERRRQRLLEASRCRPVAALRQWVLVIGGSAAAMVLIALGLIERSSAPDASQGASAPPASAPSDGYAFEVNGFVTAAAVNGPAASAPSDGYAFEAAGERAPEAEVALARASRVAEEGRKPGGDPRHPVLPAPAEVPKFLKGGRNLHPAASPGPPGPPMRAVPEQLAQQVDGADEGVMFRLRMSEKDFEDRIVLALDGKSVADREELRATAKAERFYRGDVADEFQADFLKQREETRRSGEKQDAPASVAQLVEGRDRWAGRAGNVMDDFRTAVPRLEAVKEIQNGQTAAPADGSAGSRVRPSERQAKDEPRLGGIARGNESDFFGAPRDRGEPAAEADPAVVLPPAQDVAGEERLRAWYFYRQLDPQLTPERFALRPLPVPPPAVGDEGLGEAGFKKRYGVNPFVETSRDPLSTFGLDVDTASFSLARALLRSGRLPPASSVRVEEFVNSFPDPRPAAPDAVFTLFADGGPSPFGTPAGGRGLELLLLTVKTRELRPAERKAAVLTLAVDTSGSMALEGRMELVRGALRLLVSSLAPEDRVAVVAFAQNAYVALPHTPARERERILAAIESLSPGGGTNVEAGLDLAYRLAGEALNPRALNRVVLCSDGVANVGARGPDDILRTIKAFAGRSVYLTAAGFGTQARGDLMLQRLADEGNGNYAHVDGLDEAARIFRESLPATLQVLAEDARVQVRFEPEAVSHYRLLGYEKRDIADERFRDDTVDAGEVGPGTTVSVLYEILRRPAAAGSLAAVELRYRDAASRRFEELRFEVPPGALAPSLEESSERLRFIACAAELAELLRQSYHARDGSYAAVIDLLESLPEARRGEKDWQVLHEMAVRAQGLTFQAMGAAR